MHEVVVIHDLTLEQAKVAIGDTDNWEVLVDLLLVVMDTSPAHDSVDSVSEVWIVEGILGVSWDVESIELLEQLLKSEWVKSVVNRHDSSSCSLKEVNVT